MCSSAGLNSRRFRFLASHHATLVTELLPGEQRASQQRQWSHREADETDDESGQSPSNQQRERIIVMINTVSTWRRKKLLLPLLPVCLKEEWKNSAAGGLDDLIGCGSHTELSDLCAKRRWFQLTRLAASRSKGFENWVRTRRRTL